MRRAGVPARPPRRQQDVRRVRGGAHEPGGRRRIRRRYRVSRVRLGRGGRVRRVEPVHGTRRRVRGGDLMLSIIAAVIQS